MKIKVIGAALILATIFSTATFAQKDNRRGERSFHHELLADNSDRQMKFDNLLTEDQKEAFKEIRMESMKQAKPLQNQLRELKAHHQTLMTAEKPDLKAIYASIDKMGELKNQLSKIRAKSGIDMQSQLSDEQKMQIQHLHSKKEQGLKERPNHKDWRDQ